MATSYWRRRLVWLNNWTSLMTVFRIFDLRWARSVGTSSKRNQLTRAVYTDSSTGFFVHRNSQLSLLMLLVRLPAMDDSSACISGSLCSSSISSGATLRWSDRRDFADRFDLLDLPLLSLRRIDVRSMMFLLIVWWRSLLFDTGVVIQSCFSACRADMRSEGSVTSSLSINCFALAETSFQC